MLAHKGSAHRDEDRVPVRVLPLTGPENFEHTNLCSLSTDFATTVAPLKFTLGKQTVKISLALRT